MVDLFNTSLLKLKEVFDELLQNKCDISDTTEKKKIASMLFVALKYSNREIKYKVREGREQLSSEKSKVDGSRLQLQNLLYEVNYLKREISKCLSFKSRDCHINLLPLETYGELNIFRPKKRAANATDHSRHLELLECELKLRKELAVQYKKLMSSKQLIFKEIVSKTERYSSFAPALQTLLNSTQPLHDALQMSLDVEWKFAAATQFLPKPLYLLYMNLKALQCFVKYNLTTEIIGFENDMNQSERVSEYFHIQKLFQNESHLAYHTSPTEPHFLSIRLIITQNDCKEYFIINIRCFEKLGFVTAHSELNVGESYEAHSEFTWTQEILDYLYPNDVGNEIPICDINYKLQEFNTNIEDCFQSLRNRNYGKPYRWLQNICAVPTFNMQETKEYNLCLQKSTREVVERIRIRWLCWMKLIKQIRQLYSKDVDILSLQESFNATELSCSLVQWTGITFEELNGYKSDALTVIEEISNVNNIYYRAVIVRGSAKMECLIQIAPTYPIESPIWIVCVDWNGHHTSTNNAAIKMIEYWTNSLKKRHLEKKCGLIYAQLLRTMSSFDIFLETECSLQLSKEYCKEKPYISAFSKRLRLRPYKYVKKGTKFAFKQ